jgi:endonuclease G, mitochondrial
VAMLLLVLLVVGCCAVVRKSREPNDASGPPAESGPESGRDSPQLSSPYCLHGCPESTRGVIGTVLHREGFVLSNNPKTKFADWVAYRITRFTMGKSPRRKWTADPDLPPEETLEPEDYRGAHRALSVDRGHQVPLASFAGTGATRPLNYLSNVTPQRSQLNQKLWNFLEQAERKLINDGVTEEVFVVTGPLFEKEMPPLPGADEAHTVPSGYFKVVSVSQGFRVSTAAFIVSQETPGDVSFCSLAVTIDEVELRAALDLFVALPDDIETPLERSRGDLLPTLGCP